MFRYSITPKMKVCVLNTKALDENRMQCRSTMLGASFHGNYDQLPHSDVAKVCWEVSWH